MTTKEKIKLEKLAERIVKRIKDSSISEAAAIWRLACISYGDKIFTTEAFYNWTKDHSDVLVDDIPFMTPKSDIVKAHAERLGLRYIDIPLNVDLRDWPKYVDVPMKGIPESK